MIVLANIIDYTLPINEYQGTYVSAKDSLDLGVLLWPVAGWLEPAPLEQIWQVPSESLLHTGTEGKRLMTKYFMHIKQVTIKDIFEHV